MLLAAVERAAPVGVSVVQRTSSDLRLNPHLHLIVLDGAWREQGGEHAWEGLGHLRTSEVGEVLERLVRGIERYLRRCGLLRIDDDEAEPSGEGDPEGNLAASAVWGQSSIPTWRGAMAEMVAALLVVVALVAAFIGMAALLRRLLP